MPYRNNWKNKGLDRVFSESTSGEEILGSNLSIQGDHRFENINYIINDFTNVVSFEISDLDVEILATIDNVSTLSKKRLQIAIVVTNEELIKWTHLYLQKMQGSSYECQIFSNYDDAYKWVS